MEKYAEAEGVEEEEKEEDVERVKDWYRDRRTKEANCAMRDSKGM